jgi:hypothetical protein
MSACARRQWGGGCQPTARPADSAAAKEMEARLAAIQAERQRQDAAWISPAAASPSKTAALPATAATQSTPPLNRSPLHAPQQQKPNLR